MSDKECPMTADTLDLEAAIDAAARAWWKRTTRSGVGFDSLNAHDQHTARAFVLPIVTAAAPVIAEQAWDEGHTVVDQPNPYRKADK